MTKLFNPNRYTLLRVTLITAALFMASAQAQTIEKTVKVAPGSLYELVVSADTGNVYVAAAGQRGDNNAQIVILNGDSLAREGSIDVAANKVFGLAINQQTQTLYGTASTSQKIVVIDAASGQVITTLDTGTKGQLREAVVDTDNNRIYVSAVGARGAKNRIWVIDGATNTLDHDIVVDTKTLTGIAFDSKNGRLFGTGMGANEIVVIDPASGKITQRWDSGGDKPVNAVYDAAGNRLFVANQGSGTLTVLDASDGKLLASVDTGAGALGVNYDAKNNRVYVANRKAGTLSVVDADSYAVVANLETGTYPQTIAINPDSDQVYVSNKAKGLPRDAPKDAVPPKDPNGDTVVLISP